MRKPQNYYCHRQGGNDQGIQLNNQCVEIVEKIGEGSFGKVYKVFDPSTCKLMVIKTNKKQSTLNLEEEKNILKQLGDSSGFHKLSQYTRQYGFSEEENMIIMPCLGSDLKTIMSKCQKFNPFTTKRIGHQILLRLQELHQHHYIHRDLKPENILMGDQDNPHKIYLIDLGLATQYKREKKRQRRHYDGLIGTAKFCSIASHRGLNQLPKDDLESLGYILLYFVTGTVPWEGQKGESEKQIFKKIEQIKLNCSSDQLCGGYNFLRKYFKYVKNLDPNDQIEYRAMEQILNVQAEDFFCFQFCSENCRGWRCYNTSKKQTEKMKIEKQPKAQPIRDSIVN